MSVVPGSFFDRRHRRSDSAGGDMELWTSTSDVGWRDPMRQPQFIRSNPFRWAFMVAGVLAIFVTVLFGFIYWTIADYLTARSDRVITVELDGIAGLSPDRRLEAIDEGQRQGPPGVQVAGGFAAT